MPREASDLDITVTEAEVTDVKQKVRVLLEFLLGTAVTKNNIYC